MEKASYIKKRKLFYGYWILAVAFWCVFIFAGCGTGVFSLFVKNLQADFGWGRGEIMIAFTIFFLFTGIASPFAGKLVDHYGARYVISIGAFVGGLGFVLLNSMQALWHFYGGYAIIGLGMAATCHVPASAMVSNWFRKRRGTAIGIMSTGVGVGVVALAPLIGGYLIPHFGWRVSYLTLAVFMWTLIPLALFVVKTKPADMGLHPDGVEKPMDEVAAQLSYSEPEGISLKMASSKPALWLIAIAFLISGFCALGIFQNQVPHLQDIGYPLEKAVFAATGVGIGSTIGKFFFGWLCDRIQAKYACAMSLLLQAGSIIILIIIKPASPVAIIWLYSIIMGLGGGGWLPTMSMLVSTNFGLISYGAIFGMLNLIHSTGGAIGPFWAGYLYDTMHTYHRAFIVILASYAVAIPSVLAARRPKSLR